MNQLSLLSLDSVDTSLIQTIEKLPPLPKTIIYEDDYDEVVRSIDVAACDDDFIIFISGKKLKINLLKFEQPLRLIVRHFLLLELIDSAPVTVHNYYNGLRIISQKSLYEIMKSAPIYTSLNWEKIMGGYPLNEVVATKAFLSYLCNLELGAWSFHFRKLVSNLPTPYRGVYSVVRAGDCFLDIQEEASLVRWIDDAANSVESLSNKEIQIASLVVSSYQFGMRPKQLGTLRKRDCEIRISKEDGLPSVYFTFRTLKQKNLMASRLPLLRKVKREWAPLVVAAYALLKNEPASAFFFDFKSRLELSNALIHQLDVILPGRGCDAYALRHSMAQRMVDAGASQEEVAAALGHLGLYTALVYFRTSKNQAEQVNSALGISETYKMVAKIAADRFISDDELASLKGEQQIAGVPHGILIAGIGGCKTGQPSCPYNPVTACYGCPKFMPVRDIPLHEQVLKDFRGVVNDFKVAGAGDQESPAYLQLRRTITEVQSVINQLEGRDVQ